MAAQLRKLQDGPSKAICVFTNPDNTAAVSYTHLTLPTKA